MHDEGKACTDPHCTHSHDAQGHHHGHGHGEGCGHSHHGHSHSHLGQAHSEAEQVVDDALVMSRRGELAAPYPLGADAAVALAKDGMQAIAEKLAVEGAVLGHIKALVDCDAGRTTVSITRTDAPDVIAHEGWDGSREVSSCAFSINVLSLANTDAEVGPLIDALFA